MRALLPFVLLLARTASAAETTCTFDGATSTATVVLGSSPDVEIGWGNATQNRLRVDKRLCGGALLGIGYRVVVVDPIAPADDFPHDITVHAQHPGFLAIDVDLGARNQQDRLIIDAGAGHDTILVTEEGVDIAGDGKINVTPAGSVAVFGNGGNDTLEASAATTPVELDGGPGGDVLYGGPFADVLRGGSGNDVLYAGEGDDRLAGGPDVDELYGEGGDDRFGEGVVENGADWIYGGDGHDAIRYWRRVDAVRVDLAGGVVTSGARDGDEGDLLHDLEEAWGGDGDDVLIGGSGPDILRGRGGDDDLDAGGGDDVLYGGLGNDDLAGEDGDDRFVAVDLDGNDGMDGGAGTDTLDCALVQTSVQIVGGQLTIPIRGETDDFASLETFVGTDFLDIVYLGDGGLTVFGGGGDDLLTGGGGSDLLDGGDGNDSFLGFAGDGNDTIHGGNGVDTFVGYDGDGSDTIDGGSDSNYLDLTWRTQGVELELGAGTLTALEGDVDLVTGIDTVFGSAGDDILIAGTEAVVLFGFGGADILVGGPGEDVLNGGEGDDAIRAFGPGHDGDDDMDGGPGHDALDYSARTEFGVEVRLFELFASGDGETDTIDGFEAVVGSEADDVIDGMEAYTGLDIDTRGGRDIVDGSKYSDTIDLGPGDDTGYGNKGNDWIYGGEGNDGINGNEGDDTVDGGPGADVVLGGGEGNDTLVCDADDAVCVP